VKQRGRRRLRTARDLVPQRTSDVFGAWQCVVGRTEVDDLFSLLERSFSHCGSYTQEIVVADIIGDLAYTVGYEHTQATVNGEPRSYTLRAAQMYRREGGEWKVVHRHGDAPPTSAPVVNE